MRITVCRRLYLALAAMLLLVMLAGCNKKQQADNDILVYASLYDVPGITVEEITAVDELREKYKTFSFGTLAGTEAFYNENGEIRGYSALFCEWLTELFGITFIPVIYEWGDLFPALKADFSGDLTATEARRTELGFLFTDSIADRTTKYFRIPGGQPRSEIIKTRPLKLAFMEGSTTSRAAMQRLNESLIPYEPLFVNDYLTIYNMLLNGEADAFVHEMVAEAGFDEIGNVVTEDFLPLIIEPVSLSTQNRELEPIINIVQKVLRSGRTDHLIDLYEQGLEEYARHKLFLRLDDQEMAYLRENAAVAYLAEYDNYPISFYNENEKQWQGIAFDILDEITVLTGLSFEPINEPNVNFADLMTMLENGEGVMLSELLRTSAREDRFIWSENDIVTANYVAISLDSTPNASIHRIIQKKVGVQTGTAYSDLFSTWFPDHPNIIEYDDTNAALMGLEKGEIELLMFSMLNLLTATNYNENPGFKANILFDYTFGSPFGFNKNEEILRSIVDKAMSVIDINTISSQWMRKTFDYRSKIIQSQRPWLIGSIVLSLIVIALLFIVYLRNRSIGKDLDRLVRRRTEELDISRQELSAALEDAKMANSAKSAFLATMSHEIRTPMNAIIGIAQIEMQKDDLTKSQTVALENIYNSGNILLGIINDILDMSKIEAGRLELNPIEYDMPSLINDAVQLNILRIGSKQIEFFLDISENLPLKLLGDELRLKQILSNLISNAIKYTEKGFTKLSVSHSIEEDPDVITLCFVVEDTGQGMRPEDVAKLFSEYSRFNTEANRTTEGAGLGLNITKRLVDMMDGTIRAESEYGKGSKFIVTVKQKTVKGAAGEVIGAEILERLRNFTFAKKRSLDELQVQQELMPYGKVLVVDDVKINLYVVEGLLSPYKLNVETANSGFAAIEKVESGNNYDVIFMDHMMPLMDGVETTQRLRKMRYKGTIVALTANATTGIEQMFKDNGFNDFISKPIDIRQLNICLNKYIRDRHSEGAQQYKQESAPVSPVFVEEKDPKLLKIFSRDAEKALVTLRNTIENGRLNGDIKLFITTVHGMKSALANIGEDEASKLAASLENAGGNNDIEFITANIENFLNMLNDWLEKHADTQTDSDSDSTQEDIVFLTEHLLKIKENCENYNRNAVFAGLGLLKEKQWKAHTAAALEEIHEALFLHSDFEKAGELVETLLKSCQDVDNV